MLNLLKKKKKEIASNRQSITVKGSALGSAATLALIIILAPVLLGFTYLIALRDPGVNEQQLQRVSQSFAAQQASNIQSLLAGMKARLQGAAQSPLALQAIANELGRDVALVEQAMLDYFPEVISLRLLPMGEMGLDS